LLVVESSSILEIELDFLEVNDLHRSTLESPFQFVARDEFCFAILDLRAALGEHSLVPRWGTRLRNSKGIPQNLHALEAFADRKFSEIGRGDHGKG